MKTNIWKTATIMALSLILVLTVVFVYLNQTPSETADGNQDVAAETAAEKAVDYINNHYEIFGVTASLVDASAVLENGVYKFSIDIEGYEYNSYVTTDGKLFFADGFELEEESSEEGSSQSLIEGGYIEVNDAQICYENEKPIIYFFGSEGCPHCTWQHPVVESVVSQFEGYVEFHENIDSEEDLELFYEYSSGGGIPLTVIGCKYYKVGSGSGNGEETEKEILTDLICEVTNNQPESVCLK